MFFTLTNGDRWGWIPHSWVSKPVNFPEIHTYLVPFPIFQLKSFSSTSSFSSSMFPKYFAYFWFSSPCKNLTGLQCYHCLLVAYPIWHNINLCVEYFLGGEHMTERETPILCPCTAYNLDEIFSNFRMYKNPEGCIEIRLSEPWDADMWLVLGMRCLINSQVILMLCWSAQHILRDMKMNGQVY